MMWLRVDDRRFGVVVQYSSSSGQRGTRLRVSYAPTKKQLVDFCTSFPHQAIRYSEVKFNNENDKLG